MLFLQTIIKWAYGLVGHSVTCLNGGEFLHVSGSLSAHFLHCSRPSPWPQWPAVSPPPCFALACIQNCPVISWNKYWEIVRFKEKGPQKMQTSFKMVNRKGKEQNELYCLEILKNYWSHRLLFSLSFHAGLSQINNLCNILSQSVHSNSLMATGI